MNVGMSVGRKGVVHRDLAARDLLAVVRANRGVTFELVIDAPFSSGFQGLIRQPNVLEVATPHIPAGGDFAYVPDAKVGGRVIANPGNPFRLLQLTDRLAFGFNAVIDDPCEVTEATTLEHGGKSAMAYFVARAFVLGGPVDFVARSGIGSAPQVRLNRVLAGPPQCVPPVVSATPDSYSASNGAVLSMGAAQGVLANDTDSAHDPLTIDQLNGAGGTPPLVGTSAKGAAVRLNGDGSFSYDPSGSATLQALGHGQSTTDSFTYRSIDGHGGAATATVTVTVSGANHPPIAHDDAAAATNDAVLNGTTVLVNDTDADGDALAVDQLNGGASLTGSSAKGAAVTIHADGTYTYNATASVALQALARGHTTTDTFTYRVTDGHGGTSTATVTVTVTGNVNHGPVAQDDSGTANNNAQVMEPSVLTNDSDSDGDTLSIDQLNGVTGVPPLNGMSAKGATVKLGPAGLYQYNPTGSATLQAIPRGQSTQDSFTYRINDGHAATSTATVAITVTGVVNHAPVAVDDTPTTSEKAAIDIPVLGNDTDLDSDALHVASVDTTGTHGTVSINLDGTVHYDPNGQFNSLGAGQTAHDTFTYKAADPSNATSASTTVDVTIHGVNDPPVVDLNGAAAGIDTSAAFTEDGGAVTVAPSTVVSDVDSANVASAQVTLTNHPDGAAESLSATTAGTSITAAAYDSSTGVLSLSGTDTLAHYQQVLASVAYSDTSQNPDPATRTLDFKVNDGALDSTVAHASVSVTPVNDAPTVDLNGAAAGIDNTATFHEAGGAITLAPSAVVGDVDNSNLVSAKITLTSRPDGAAESLSVDTTGTSITAGTYDSSTGVLSLSGSDTVAHYQQALQTVKYGDSASGPNSTARVVNFTVNDGTVDSAVAKTTVTVIPLDAAPVVDLNGAPAGIDTSAAFTEDSGGAILAPSATVTDTDTANLASATVTLTNRPDGVAESLSANTAGTSITAISYDSSTGVLSLTGSDTVAHYQQVLQTVKYDNSSNTPDTTARSIQFKANDGTLDSAVATVTLSVTPHNDAPTVDLNGAGGGIDNTAAFAEDAGAVSLASAAVVGDVDNANLASASITLSNHPDAAAESLAVNTAGTSIVAAAYNSTTGVLSLSGSDTVAHYQQVLRTATYNNTSQNPDAASRVVNFTVNDGTVDSAVAQTTVSVTPVNDPPVVDMNGAGAGIDSTAAFTEDSPPITGSGPVALGSSAAVSDVDNANLASATVTLTNHPDGAAESLSANTAGTSIVAAAYNSSTGVLSLSGSDTVAHYQQVMRSVKYDNSSNTPDPTDRTIDITVNDGALDSAVAHTTVSVTPTNDSPTAVDQTFNGANSAIGNTRLGVGTTAGQPGKTISGTVLTGASDPDGPGPLIAVAGHFSTANGGSGHMNSDGMFTYDPPAGFTGDDTFNYTVSDQNTPTAGTTTKQVTVHVQSMVWYVNNALGSNGNGTSNSPFNTLANINAAGGTGDSDTAGDTIFLYQGSGAYTGGLPLENNQTLVSQRAGLTIGSDTLLTASGSNATIANASGNALALADSNTIQGIDLGTASGASLSGSSFTGTAVMDTTTSGSIDNPTGKAVDISGGDLNTVFSSISSGSTTGSPSEAIKLANVTGTFTGSGGTLQNATNADIAITGGASADNANITYNGSISDSTGTALSVDGQGGGTKAFGGAIGSGAISLTNSTGATINFTGALTLSTGANPAFAATGGGTVTATNTASTLTTTTGTALNVANATIGAGGLTFRSIAAGTAASGPSSGIILNNTGSSGGLTVAGTGSAGTGGTIQKTSSDGISLTSTASVNLSDINVTNSTHSGILGQTVNGISLTGLSITGNGTVDTVDCGIRLVDTSGAITFASDTVSGSHADNVQIDSSNTSSAATSTLTVTNGSYSSSLNGMGFLVQLKDHASIGAGEITGATFASNASMGMNIVTNDNTTIGDSSTTAPGSGPAGSVTVTNSTFTNNGGLGVSFASGGGNAASTMYVRFTNNTLIGTKSHAINVVSGASSTGGTQKVLIDGNHIGTAGVPASGSQIGEGIVVTQQGKTVQTVTITNNVIRALDNAASGPDSFDARGIDVQALGPVATGLAATTADYSIVGNNVDQQYTGSALNIQYAIYVAADDQGSPTTVNAAIHGNTVPTTNPCDTRCGAPQGMIQFEQVVAPSTGTLFNFSGSGASVSSEIANTNTGTAGQTDSPNTGLSLTSTPVATVP